MSFKKYMTVGFVGAALVAVPGFAVAGDKSGKAKEGGHKMMEKMFSQADADGDGVITKAEFLKNAEERFDNMDGNGNGKLTKEEAVAHHKAMRAKWKKIKADKARQEAIEAMKAVPEPEVEVGAESKPEAKVEDAAEE